MAARVYPLQIATGGGIVPSHVDLSELEDEDIVELLRLASKEAYSVSVGRYCDQKTLRDILRRVRF